MKKNRIIIVVNLALIFTIPIILFSYTPDSCSTVLKISPKKLSTSLMNLNNKNEFKEELLNEEENTNVEIEDVIDIEESTDKVSFEYENEEKNKPIPSVVEEEKNDIIKSYTGKMSFYNANCSGCSGLTSTGVDISDGKLFYYDSTYGNVRIIAAGTEIKKWSIVRLKNTSLGEDVLAIVLDRGGIIGEGKTFLIDMLTNNDEKKDGVERNIIVEVIREGK